MRKGLLLLVITLFISCKKDKEFKPGISSVEADVLLEDNISIRALTIDGDKVWYAGSNGKYGSVSLNGGKALNGIIAKDTLMPEFRAIAQTKTDIFILNAGTPALLYKISKDGKKNKLVYTETGEKVFYDSMQFYNDKDGIAM
ncbi:MAG: oxidoreductase, partial [Chitinophagaceae bacterium]